MAEIWEAGQEVKDLIRDLIKEHHPELSICADRIAVLFKEKASKSGGIIIPGRAKKAPGLLEILGRRPYVFVLEIGGDHWLTLSDKQRVALLDHLLCACRVKSTDEGELKFYLAPPEFCFYKGEILRHGIWQNIQEDDNDSDAAATHIEERFGVSENESENADEEDDDDDDDEDDF